MFRDRLHTYNPLFLANVSDTAQALILESEVNKMIVLLLLPKAARVSVLDTK